MKQSNNQVKQVTFKGRYAQRPENFPGLITIKQSMTIPGQDFTVKEILRKFVTGVPIQNATYLDFEKDKFDKMSKIDKADFLQNLSKENMQTSIQINNTKQKLQHVLDEKRKLENNMQLEKEIREKIKFEPKIIT